MANYYTVWVDENTTNHKLNAVSLNLRFGELDDQIYANALAIAAKIGYTWASTLVDLLANDGAGSTIDADLLDGLHATDIAAAAGASSDFGYPKRGSDINNTTWDGALPSTTDAQGICIDSLGNVWVGIHNSADWKCQLRKYSARDIGEETDYVPAGTGYLTGIADYKVVDLIAWGAYVFVLLAGPTTDGWGVATTTPGTQGKLALVNIADGTLVTAWGTNGVVNLVDSGSAAVADPWAMCIDEDYIFIACLTDPGTLVRVSRDSGACTGTAFAAGYTDATSVACLSDLTASHKVLVGFHDVTGAATYSSFGIAGLDTVPVSYAHIDGTQAVGGVATDMHQVERLLAGPGCILATLGAGTDVLVISVDQWDPASGTSLKYNILTLPSGAALATARGLALSPEGVAYVADPAANGHLVRAPSLGASAPTFAGSQYKALGANIVINNLMHDGRCLWGVGNDGTTAYVFKLAA